VHPSPGLSFINSFNSPPQSIQGNVANWVGGIKSKPSSIMDFRKLPQVCLAKAHATTLETNARQTILENRPHLQKLHYASLTKTLVSEILQQIVFRSTK
jgi:hypothetical protein